MTRLTSSIDKGAMVKRFAEQPISIEKVENNGESSMVMRKSGEDLNVFVICVRVKCGRRKGRKKHNTKKKESKQCVIDTCYMHHAPPSKQRE